MNVGKFRLQLCKFLFHSVNVVSSLVEQMHGTTELLSSKGLWQFYLFAIKRRWIKIKEICESVNLLVF